MFNFFKNKQSFTLVELLLVIGIMALLYGFSVVSVGKVQESAYINSNLDVLVSDMKQQQIKAMVGDTEGRATGDNYGLYFQPVQNQYTLFHGTVYNANDAANFVVKLHSTVQISSVTFPSSTLLFSQISGEVSGFASGSNTITLRSTVDGAQKIITVNRYGVITQIN